MQDTDEGTYFGDVQTASVKRHIAKDSNNEKLYNASMMEMIGHLSKDNKETYLKHAQPLQKYIDAKDEFDFKHNNYTTTENVDKTPDEKVRRLQRELNEAGYTDKFGQRLKEDGIYAGKTAYAGDNYKADNPNVSKYSAVQNDKKFSVKDLSKEDIEKIGKYVYENDYDPTVLALSFTDDGKVESYPTTVNASGPMASIYKPATNILQDNIELVKSIPTSNIEENFDYNTRLSYNQNYSYNVQILQKKLSELGYLNMSNGGWGYFGPKTLEAVNKYKKDKNLGNTGKDEGIVGKDTWKSLGLIYRTQEDIDAGVTVVTIDGKQYKDVSIPINRALNRDKKIFMENADDLDWFKEQVGDDGPWNIKKYDEGVYTWEETIGSSFPGYDETMILYGHKVTVEDIGNITYGYLGKAAKLTDAILYVGSAYNDFKNHWFSNFDGENRDRYWIGVGIEWYKSTTK